MIDVKVRLLATLSLVLVLSGCGNLGLNSKEKPAVETGKKEPETQKYVAEAGLSSGQRFTKSLEYLDNGNEGQALVELQAYLLEVPGSSSVKRLIEQINTDPSEYFPKDYFTVELKSGASLSTLAKKYLGSALRFYALAKYNNISNPSRVNIGQQIKIPATQLARMVRDKQKVEDEKALAAIDDSAQEMPEEELPMADDTMEAKVDEGVAIIEESANEEAAAIEEFVPEVEEIVVSAESLIEDIRGLNESGDFSEAMLKAEELKKFGELTPASEELLLSTVLGYADQMKATDKTVASKYYFEAAEMYLENEDQFAAFENFKQASELDLENNAAMEEMLVLQKDISDKYHREASTAFRRQELDLAIATWDKVLAVNPDHSNAQLYRAQAIELKERLEKINKN